MNEFIDLVKQVWQDGIYGIDIGHILTGMGIFILFVLLRNIFSRLIVGRIQRIVNKTSNELDDAILATLEAPIRLIPVVLGIFFATSYLEVQGQAELLIGQLNRSLIALTIFWALYRASDPLSEILKTADHVLTSSMIDWLTKALKAAFIILGTATILEIWGIQVGPLIAGLGLFGVAVALGAQDMFKNLIAGLFILGEHRFNPGDWILVKGTVEGTVEKIGFRTTTIRRFDKAPVYVPNTALADNSVTNFSRMTYRRIKWVIGLEYNTSKDQLLQVRGAIEDYLKNNDDFVSPEDTATFVRIDRFSDSSIDILLYCFTKTTDWLEWLRIKEEFLLEIKGIVEDAEADFAFPSQSLYIESMGENFEAFPKKG